MSKIKCVFNSIIDCVRTYVLKFPDETWNEYRIKTIDEQFLFLGKRFFTSKRIVDIFNNKVEKWYYTPDFNIIRIRDYVNQFSDVKIYTLEELANEEREIAVILYNTGINHISANKTLRNILTKDYTVIK